MTVMITGASGGLGRAFALECAARGYDLFLTDVDAGALERVSGGVRRQYGVRIDGKSCDLRDPRSVEEMFQYARGRDVRLDMLINVAGLDHEGGFAERGFEDIRDILRVNVEATLSVTHAALGMRREGARFFIVFVSSLASMYPMPLKATYAASKRFLLDFSIALGQELRARDVSVLALCPGGMPTREDCVQAIAAQGFWGRVTSSALEKVARRTIDGVLRGKRLYVPGTVNRLFSMAAPLISPRTAAKLVYRRWSAAQKKWMTV